MSVAKAWCFGRTPGIVWRLVRHRHIPFHPGEYELWYCARCRLALCWQGWLPRDHPELWVPFEPHQTYRQVLRRKRTERER